jgi:Flp pilus assembly protein TadD
VEIDSTAVGKTGESGSLELPDVEPGDHYIHVHCPDEEEGRAHFISVQAGESVEIRHEKIAPAAASPDPLAVAQARIELRQHLQDAIRLRARGKVEEAVRNLREALRLDPENSDLHRELGITFLLAKEWKRARVEMLEAVRHKPDDADAYNGLGYSLEKLEDFEGAVEAYRAATKLEPTDSTYRQHYFGALAKLSAQQAEKKK